jgi:HPt (histidine-containing phosphotransfer) domain-containing protein
MVLVAMTASAMQGDREKCLESGMDDYIAKPVRLEDVRAIIERWATRAAGTESKLVTGNGGSTEPGQTSVGKRQQTVRDEPPVDMERLHEFTDGSADSLRELVMLYLGQTSEQLDQLEAAVAASAPSEVRRIAHSCAGASATCGMSRLVPLLRELERQGFEGKLTNAAEVSAAAAREFDCIRAFLKDYLAEPSELAVKSLA